MHVTAQLPPNQTKFHLGKGINSAFYHMEFFCLIKRIVSVKIGLFLQEITLLPTFLTGSKLDFQVANLLLATVNFEP